MIFTPTPIDGVVIVDLDLKSDERGFFARSWCAKEFADHNLNPRLVQCNISYNNRRGILRGLHYQEAPFAEAKLVRCTSGAIFDVAVDLRRDSKSYQKWFGSELSAANRRMLYLPEGVAHGFQTLSEMSEVFYQMSEFYHPESSRTVLWSDPAFAIEWPIENPVLSHNDASARAWTD